MPELPEVETVKETLNQLVKNKTIKDVHVFWPKMIKKPDDVEQFRQILIGQTIQQVKRRGKFLKFILDDYVLVSHLRMEGKYAVYPHKTEKDKHTHVIFTFTDLSEMHYRDVRKFGTMHLFKKGEEELVPPLNKLGLEPFDESFTPNYLKESLKKSSRTIKAFLLDQGCVTGLGNIYVDEALFRAKIMPNRTASKIKAKEIPILHEAIVTTLSEAVKKGGSTVRSYVNSQGQIGMFQLELNVYSREEMPCNVCGNEIVRVVVATRGTRYCSRCQK